MTEVNVLETDIRRIPWGNIHLAMYVLAQVSLLELSERVDLRKGLEVFWTTSPVSENGLSVTVHEACTTPWLEFS